MEVAQTMPKKFWSFKAATDKEPAELLLYGDISSSSWWGDEVTPKQFKQDLDDLGDVTEISVYINSDGGDVFAGQAIYSMLKRHNANITVFVDGLAASIASVIAMAGDKVIMPKNAMMMIHHPWTWGVGNSKDFRKLADDMDKIGESIIAVYEGRSSIEKNKIVELMDAETWLSAEEAVNYGFADEIEQEKAVAASLNDGFLILNGQKMDLARFKNAPKLAFISSQTVNTKVEQPKEGVLSLYETQMQINKNMIGGIF
jgi:ATP-dependent Clp protease protease subunit